MMRIEDIIAGFPKRAAASHKGDYGHVLVIAGSSGYTGAAYFASQAAALSGSGLVTLAVGKSIYPVLAVKLSEVMVRPVIETKDASPSLMAEKDIVALAERCDCLALGPGISRNKETQTLARNLVAKVGRQVVLDADGINAFDAHVDALKKAKVPLILTPHPGEFGALIGKEAAAVQDNRKELALTFANQYNTILVLKGHETIVAHPDGRFYVNQTGNPGMAAGGVGDILTGMIASFAGQGIAPFNAAILGVYFHGLAGDLAMKEKGVLSLLATDILRKLPEAFKALDAG